MWDSITGNKTWSPVHCEGVPWKLWRISACEYIHLNLFASNGEKQNWKCCSNYFLSDTGPCISSMPWNGWMSGFFRCVAVCAGSRKLLECRDKQGGSVRIQTWHSTKGLLLHVTVKEGRKALCACACEYTINDFAFLRTTLVPMKAQKCLTLNMVAYSLGVNHC